MDGHTADLNIVIQGSGWLGDMVIAFRRMHFGFRSMHRICFLSQGMQQVQHSEVDTN